MSDKEAAFTGELAFCSNFYPAPCVFEGVLYPTSEHAFQAAKTLDPKERETIRKATTAGQAKKLGRQVTLRSDWMKVRLQVMETCLRSKFSHPDMMLLLQATKGRQLSEINWWNDTFWGVCRGKGEDHLGKLLMRIRDEQ